jgi:hypothetical protein
MQAIFIFILIIQQYWLWLWKTYNYIVIKRRTIIGSLLFLRKVQFQHIIKRTLWRITWSQFHKCDAAHVKITHTHIQWDTNTVYYLSQGFLILCILWYNLTLPRHTIGSHTFHFRLIANQSPSRVGCLSVPQGLGISPTLHELRLLGTKIR